MIMFLFNVICIPKMIHNSVIVIVICYLILTGIYKLLFHDSSMQKKSLSNAVLFNNKNCLNQMPSLS